MATKKSTSSSNGSDRKSNAHTKKLELPRSLEKALWLQQQRVYEALGVAKILTNHLVNAPASGFAGEDIDTLENSAKALVRLLEPIDGLADVVFLRQLVEHQEVANG
jgi:hypothetical protein